MPGFDLKTAIQLTAGTIDRRAAHFRNLVIGVVALSLIPAVWALIQWSWMPLIGILGIIPLCLAFACMDIKKIDHWQVRILAAWRQEDFNLNLFSQTMTTLRSFPSGTLKAMLATLPTRAIPESGQPLGDEVKSIVSEMVKTNSQCQFYRTTAFGMAVTFVLAALVCALALRSWYPFLLFFASLICIPLYHLLPRFRLGRLEQKISDLQNEQDREALLEIMNKLDLDAIAGKRKNRWLARLKATLGHMLFNGGCFF